MDVKSLLILKCFCILILYFNPIVEGDIPHGLCANPKCSEPLGKGKTILRYYSPDDSRISVDINEEVEIFVKDYGPKKDLLGIIVRGHRGYVSKQFIKETQSFGKKPVPAVVEFKTPVLTTNAYTVTSNLHVSSHHHQSDGILSDSISESVIHTQILQQDYIKSAPSSSDQKWNQPMKNLQASHLSPNFNPSDNVQIGLNSKFDQSSQSYDIQEPSSHFHFDSGNSFASSHVTGLKSENILPSESHVPDMRFSTQYQDDTLLNSLFSESEVNNVPNFGQKNSLDYLDSDIFDSNYVLPSQTFQSFNQHPSSIQRQEKYQSSVPEMHSSFSPDYYNPESDEDMSKTFAMLSNRGFDNSEMFADSYPESHGHQSSQNIEKEYVISEAEFNIVPSQSLYPSIQSSDTSFYSLEAPSPSIVVENKGRDSDIPKEIDMNPPHEDIGNSAKSSVSGKISAVEELEDENESEDITAEDDGEEEDEEEEAVGDFSEADNTVPSSKDVGSTTNEFHLESSMSSTLSSQQSSEALQDVQSSVEDSTVESNLDTLQEENSTLINQEISTSLNELVSPNTGTRQLETEISGDTFVQSTVDPSIVASTINKDEATGDFNLTKKNLEEPPKMISNAVNPNMGKNSLNSDTIHEKNFEAANDPFPKKDMLSDIPDRNNNDALQAESTIYNEEHIAPSINDFFVENEQNSELEKIVNTVNIDEIGEGLRSTYQIRNLKGEYMTTEEQQSDSDGSNEENNTDTGSNVYSSFENGLNALKSFVDSIMSWIPEPLYSTLMDLQNKGISPRVPVFTALCGIISIFLIVPLFYIKEWSKESRLSTQLASVEKKAYTLSATNTVLEEKLESVESELSTLQASLKEGKSISQNLKLKFEDKAEELKATKAELESCLEELDSLKVKENEYLSLLNDHEKEKENLLEHKSSLDRIITDQENSITNLAEQLQERENDLKELEKEKVQFLQMKEEYEEKISVFDRNCNQLLQEAEVWNLRVNELTLKLNEETTSKEELEATLKEKDEEIESLKQLVETFKTFEEIEDPEGTETKEEKLQYLVNSSMILNQLKKEEDKSKVLEEQLGIEKSKILDMEVESLEAKSEIDKLKMSYNQALQDKAEAQTKLDVLTNYFKDKEIQLQKQLGAQEAVRQKKEEDANSAERRICLIEQENASYKYQVASMKQEMEETERNLKTQIAAQEKKAHENWIAARAAERKLEDMKQEVTQLRQRLTLLEREQENWTNSTRDDIIRPVPKRMPGANEESGSQDMNTSERGRFPPPPLHDHLPPHMMLPPDRPLPPLPPPPMPPMFLPPMERHFRPQPWHLPPEHSSDYRTTPPEFIGGRESTPPRGRPSTIIDGESGPHASSPLTTDTRDSRNSTPPHLLPDFHDIPPQPGRPFYPPPHLGHHPRLPMHPPYRRDPGPKRLDNSNEYNSRGSQQPPSQEQWQHSRV